jgi:hypothetical protein
MRLTVSRELHYLWEQAAFVIVPSQNTRSQMIEILHKDRARLSLAQESKQVVEPCQLAVSQRRPEHIDY